MQGEEGGGERPTNKSKKQGRRGKAEKTHARTEREREPEGAEKRRSARDEKLEWQRGKDSQT